MGEEAVLGEVEERGVLDHEERQWCAGEQVQRWCSTVGEGVAHSSIR
jgi:hypothetical protein